MKYSINIYSGGVFCGNGIFETLEQCTDYFNNDLFADKAVITDTETRKRTTIKKESDPTDDYNRWASGK